MGTQQTARDDQNRADEAEGRAYFIDDESVGRLKVSFFGPFYGGYNVLELDDDYQWALVAGPNRDYLWILARTPTLESDVEQRLRKVGVTDFQELGQERVPVGPRLAPDFRAHRLRQCIEHVLDLRLHKGTLVLHHAKPLLAACERAQTYRWPRHAAFGQLLALHVRAERPGARLGPYASVCVARGR